MQILRSVQPGSVACHVAETIDSADKPRGPSLSARCCFLAG